MNPLFKALAVNFDEAAHAKFHAMAKKYTTLHEQLTKAFGVLQREQKNYQAELKNYNGLAKKFG